MEISAVIAQEIVLELKNVIEQEVNFMNRKGIIIASTDLTRIGTFHEGAQTVMETKQPIIIDSDDEYTGSKKGINMPIAFENETIGVVGITGEQLEVEKNGMIIKKMTEILIREDFVKDIHLKKNERSSYIINRILNYPAAKQTKTDSDIFYYDYSISHFCVIGNFDTSTPYDFSYDEVYRIIDLHTVENEKVISIIIEGKLHLYVQQDNPAHIYPWLKKLAKQISAYANRPFYFGIGPIARSLLSANTAFEYATDALAWNKKHVKKPSLDFTEMDIGLLLTSIDDQRISIIKDRVLSTIPEKEYCELRTILFTYGAFNKSVNQSADKLYIHKNTFQYKLDKITEYTGYNPRILNDYVCLYLAFLLDDPMESVEPNSL